MTTVVALREGQSTWIGADRAYSSEGEVAIGLTSKLTRTRAGWVGYVGDVASAQRFAVHLAEHATSDPSRSVRAAVDALGRCDDVAGLLIDGHGIWYLDAAGVALKLRDRSASIGSGGQAALAALRALGEFSDLEPAARIRRALRYASALDPGTAPPFDVRRIDAP